MPDPFLPVVCRRSEARTPAEAPSCRADAVTSARRACTPRRRRSEIVVISSAAARTTTSARAAVRVGSVMSRLAQTDGLQQLLFEAELRGPFGKVGAHLARDESPLKQTVAELAAVFEGE